MPILERVAQARREGYDAAVSIEPVVVQTQDERDKQKENWLKLGEKVGFAVEELTGVNIFNPTSNSETSPKPQGEWKVQVLNGRGENRMIFLRKKQPGKKEHVIAASYTGMLGLTITGRNQELSESVPGSREPRDSSREEIEAAFVRAVLFPMIRGKK